jgi:hypothetical protein
MTNCKVRSHRQTTTERMNDEGFVESAMIDGFEEVQKLVARTLGSPVLEVKNKIRELVVDKELNDR